MGKGGDSQPGVSGKLVEEAIFDMALGEWMEVGQELPE